MVPFILVVLISLAHSSEWVSLSESLNPKQIPLPETLTSRHSISPSLTFWHGHLYLSWTEPDSHGIQQIYLKKLTEGMTWEQIGKSHNKDRTHTSSTPIIVSNGDTLFLCWTERNDDNVSQVYMKKWNGKDWEFLGGSLNTYPEKEAKSPTVAFLNGIPYVAWNESGEKEWSKLYIKHWDGASWIPDGPGFGLEPQHITQAPFLIFDKNRGHLVWAESDEMRVFQIHYASLLDGQWNELKPGLNENLKMQAFNPSLAIFNNELYLVFQEKTPEDGFKIQLRHLTPEGWKSEDSRLVDQARKSFNPGLSFDHETMLISWEEWDASGIPNIAVQALTRDKKAEISFHPSDNDPKRFQLNPILVRDEQSTYLVWKETANNDLYQIQIRKYLP